MMPVDVAVEEGVFQAVHLVDLQQSLDIRRRGCGYYAGENRCLSEGESVLDGGWLIGSHPKDAAVYAYMGGEAVLHAAVTVALVRWCPRWTVRAWEVTTISVDGATVIHNARIGLRVRF